MSEPLALRELSVTVTRSLLAIRAHVPALQQLARTCGQAGSMHGLEVLLGSRFVRRKRPCLVCFHDPLIQADTAPLPLAGAVLLLEYRLLGLPLGVFATTDSFGVRTVVGPEDQRGALCLLASRFLLRSGARLVLTTWRLTPGVGPVLAALDRSSQPLDSLQYALSTRTVQDTLLLGATAEETLQTLGKRTRVHMRAARRRFDTEYPEAVLRDATAALADADDTLLRSLNQASLDVIDQGEFNHQVRTLCQSPGGFVLGLWLEDRWIALIGGWRQDAATWIEWQCNARGFEKLSLGSVLRTYLLEEEAARGAVRLGFHGGTSHSMLHRFQETGVADLLVRRSSLVTAAFIGAVRWLAARRPALLLRGNFLLDAVCAPGLAWSVESPEHSAPPSNAHDA